MSAKLRIWVLVLLTLCLQVPAGASLHICLCGLESLFTKPIATCCSPVERASCCTAPAERTHNRTQVQRDSSCQGSEHCGCHFVSAPERDGASTLPAARPAAEFTLALWTAGTFTPTLAPAIAAPDLPARVCEPPGRRRNLPLLI